MDRRTPVGPLFLMERGPLCKGGGRAYVSQTVKYTRIMRDLIKYRFGSVGCPGAEALHLYKLQVAEALLAPACTLRSQLSLSHSYVSPVVVEGGPLSFYAGTQSSSGRHRFL